MKKEANKEVNETDYEAKVYRLAKQIALDAHRGYSEADLIDVRNLLLRNIPRGEIHLYARVPRYRVTKILRDLWISTSVLLTQSVLRRCVMSASAVDG